MMIIQVLLFNCLLHYLSGLPTPHMGGSAIVEKQYNEGRHVVANPYGEPIVITYSKQVVYDEETLKKLREVGLQQETEGKKFTLFINYEDVGDKIVATLKEVVEIKDQALEVEQPDNEESNDAVETALTTLVSFFNYLEENPHAEAIFYVALLIIFICLLFCNWILVKRCL
ncbi:hypothetical protein QR680_006720 [Steinernema hermaphroditum]|uniref:Uncharacterized protein n=1 Tax=Steinernema hermaphroditum TaxID=289476 RepID=A0AA39LXV9_9BILA|nr:hypothetical protein QR680_006720 [Steinernema hermaphroditum]